MRTIQIRLGVGVEITEDEEKAIFSSDSSEAGAALKSALSRGGWKAGWDSYIPGPWIDEFNRENGTDYPAEDIGFDVGNIFQEVLKNA
ncbi:MAG: hypothetical protein IJ711_00050 [Lachnospiraceae bacterium]|nr:hypothetical protein [Clostridia bacterium]MBR1691146.1 hypothetical protein [Lachnospiraceae bacterium]